MRRARRWVAWAAPLLVGVACSEPAPVRLEVSPEVDEGLAPAGAPTMSTKLERTIFGVDVLRVSARFGRTTSEALAELLADAEEEEMDEEALMDSIASVALVTGNAMIQIELLRDVDLARFLEETRRSLTLASEGGSLAVAQREKVSEQLEAWFSFLEERGLVEGDVLVYRIRGDTVRTLYHGMDGYRLLDQTDPNGPEVRAAVLAGYLAPGVELRDELAGSLLDD